MPSFAFHPGFAGQSIRSNPWKPTQFIVSTSEHFGIVGSGKVYVVETAPGCPTGSAVPLVGCFGTPDGAMDACFSEVDPHLVAVACGDGVKLYRLPEVANQNGARPVWMNVEHQAEVSCVVWNSAKRDTFFSASWDGSVKMYGIEGGCPRGASLLTLQGEHMKEVYEVAVSARSPSNILSCSGDGTWKLWDLRQPQRSVATQLGHQNQIILSIDFNKHDPNLFATGGVDRSVRVWDARKSQSCVVSFPGHEQACRRVRWSPHHRLMLASGGYDMRVNVWDLSQPSRPLTCRFAHHREFVLGLEWSITSPNSLATCSYDGTAFFVNVGQPPSPSPASTPLPAALPPPRVPRPRPRVSAGLPSPLPSLPSMMA